MMQPPKPGYRTRRPLYKFSSLGLATVDAKGNQYLPPEAVTDPVPFSAARCCDLPYLYHAGTAWGIDAYTTAPSSDEAFANTDAAETLGPSVMAYVPSTTRPWGQAGRLLRVIS